MLNIRVLKKGTVVQEERIGVQDLLQPGNAKDSLNCSFPYE